MTVTHPYLRGAIPPARRSPAPPVTVAQDRTLTVPPGATVHTTYVPIHHVRLACRDRMAVGDVESAYRRRLQLGSSQPWPPPVGAWEKETKAGEEGGPNGRRTFVLHDGRHEYVATLMLGHSHILVAWIEESPEPGEGAP